ncbi:MAG: MBL fold metallo-hydrolase [Opitutaceae bacterium]|nr:MBL fold metallo-hydrolase [Opitutaceae bacterium]
MNSAIGSNLLVPALTPEVAAFFDQDSNTFSYIVRDPKSDACAIIDSVLNFDYASGHYDFEGANQIINFIEKHHLSVQWHIETHVHADHLSAAPYLQEKLGGKLGIGKHITIVQESFGKIFNEGSDFQRDGSQFDHLFEDSETYTIGNLTAMAIHTPGHTPACMNHVVGGSVFVGDTLFLPDSGTARADFPGGSAKQLFKSIQKILSLPPEFKLYMCHDYGSNGREVEYQTTVMDQLNHNIHANSSVTESEFVEMREIRDATLGMPRLIIPSIQVNMRGGHFPNPESNDVIYLKVPINAL